MRARLALTALAIFASATACSSDTDGTTADASVSVSPSTSPSAPATAETSTSASPDPTPLPGANLSVRKTQALVNETNVAFGRRVDSLVKRDGRAPSRPEAMDVYDEVNMHPIVLLEKYVVGSGKRYSYCLRTTNQKAGVIAYDGLPIQCSRGSADS